MAVATLQFRSRELMLGPLDDATPSQVDYEGWRLREEFAPNEHDAVAPGLGSYRFFVERDLEVGDSGSESNANGVELVEEIERLWAFAAGVPLRGKGFGVELVIPEPPAGWTSNRAEAERALDRANGQQLTATISFHSRHWRYVPSFPLVRLHPALLAYQGADEVTQVLVELHYVAQMSSSAHGRILLFAKALEVVRTLLPGATDDAKEKNLPPEIRTALSHPLHRLYDLSNNRRDTRHAVVRGSGTILHPEMPQDEHFAFLRDADLLIRHVVCERLGLDTIIIKDGSPPVDEG